MKFSLASEIFMRQRRKKTTCSPLCIRIETCSPPLAPPKCPCDLTELPMVRRTAWSTPIFASSQDPPCSPPSEKVHDAHVTKLSSPSHSLPQRHLQLLKVTEACSPISIHKKAVLAPRYEHPSPNGMALHVHQHQRLGSEVSGKTRHPLFSKMAGCHIALPFFACHACALEQVTMKTHNV